MSPDELTLAVWTYRRRGGVMEPKFRAVSGTRYGYVHGGMVGTGRDTVEDVFRETYGHWTPEQLRQLYEGQWILDEPEDRLHGGECD